MKSIALTREVSPKLAECELTHLKRSPIDIDRAISQHSEYENTLKKLGYSIKRLPATPDLPDGVFVEDTAVVFPEIAIITHPGAESRRAETVSMADTLKEYRELKFIRSPGTADGGDVFTLGKKVFIGHSSRTNMEGIKQFEQILKPFGYKIIPVQVKDCLHLKTAVAFVDEGLLLINPNWLDPKLFPDYHCEPVHPDEPFGANVIIKDNKAMCPLAFPKTEDWLTKKEFEVLTIDQSEFAKAEAGLTCCSVIID